MPIYSNNTIKTLFFSVLNLFFYLLKKQHKGCNSLHSIIVGGILRHCFLRVLATHFATHLAIQSCFSFKKYRNMGKKTPFKWHCKAIQTVCSASRSWRQENGGKLGVKSSFYSVLRFFKAQKKRFSTATAISLYAAIILPAAQLYPKL